MSEEILKNAESLKDRGNKEYGASNWLAAIDLYTKAIQTLLGDHQESSVATNLQTIDQKHRELLSIIYSNRSIANIQLGKHKEALSDAQHGIACDSTFSKAYLRAGDAHIQLGNDREAKDMYLQCIRYIKVDPNDATMNAHNLILEKANNGLNNAKMRIFYMPIMRGHTRYDKVELRYLDSVREKSLFAMRNIKKGEVVFIDEPYAHQINPKCIDDAYEAYHVAQCGQENEGPIANFRAIVSPLSTAASFLLAEKMVAIMSVKLKKRLAKNCNLAYGTVQHLKRSSLIKLQPHYTGNNLEALQAQFKPLVDLLKQAYGLRENDKIAYKMDKLLQEEFDKLFSCDTFDGLLGMINYNSAATAVACPPEQIEKLFARIKGKNVAIKPTRPLRLGVYGVGVYPVHACMNHSCVPNVEISVSRQDGAVRDYLVVRATKNIAAGQEILSHYCDVDLPTVERKDLLSGQYGFDCNCNKCLTRK
eukprot:gene2928-3368_t